MHPRQRHGCPGTLLVLLAILAPWPSAFAGGGPENVFLVVNPLDDDSLTIANHFIAGRQIPLGSVFYLPWDGPPFQTDLATFRAKILEPILETMEKRKLSRQIDYVVYSSGYPYAIDFSSEVDDGTIAPVGSLTGLTYLYEYVLEGKHGFQSLSANRYAASSMYGTATRAFRSRYGMDYVGNRTKNDLGRHYLLSMMLGYTTGKRNNTVDEVLSYLRRGTAADGTTPRGTIYYVQNSDTRSRVRHHKFPDAVKELRQSGVSAEILGDQTSTTSVLPVSKNDVQGLMIGKAKFDWPASGSTLLPGAICDNLTSYGGVMSGQRSQTLLADFLRAGAVASSGTVVEPHAVHQKFPHPLLHVHYARGCSVAEAYYQSVAGPYQLLIVGDPLCQPWAQAPKVVVDGVDTSEPLSGTLTFTVQATSRTGEPIRYIEVYLDGQLVIQRLPGKPITIDTAKLGDGYHELRVVAVEDSRIETQGRVIVPFISINQDRNLVSRLSPVGNVVFADQPASLTVNGPDSGEIRVYRGRQVIGRLEGSQGQIPLDVQQLGSGPVTVQVVGFPKPSVGAPQEERLLPVFGRPITLTVAPRQSDNVAQKP